MYPTTVINWINTGKLKAFTTPGGHRRVSEKDLKEFLETYHYPVSNFVIDEKKSILIVDDMSAIVELLTRAFSKYSQYFDIQSCTDGYEALLKIGNNPPDLIIVDLLMPDVDGFKICHAIQSQSYNKKVKIIIITGTDIEESRQKLEGIEVEDFFPKPIDIEKLILKSLQSLEINTNSN